MLYRGRFEYEQASRSQPRHYLRSEIALKIVEIHYAVEAVCWNVEILEIDHCCSNARFALARKMQAFLKSTLGDIERDHFKPLLSQKDGVSPRACRKVERKTSARNRVPVFSQKPGRLARGNFRAAVSRFPFLFVRHPVQIT